MFISEVEEYFREVPKYVIIFHRPDKSFYLLRREAQNNFSLPETAVSQTLLVP
jgi:hypothetical protein